MRGGWAIGLLVLLGACGVETSRSDSGPTRAPVAATSPASIPVLPTVPASEAPDTAPTTSGATTTSASTTSVSSVPGLDGEWQATRAIVDGQPVQLIDDAPITLTAHGSQLSGSAACNSYEFTVEFEDGGVDFVGGVVTDIGCEPPIDELQAIFLESFRGAATYVVDDTTLTWTTANGTWSFERVPPEPATPLVGTTWVLDGVLYEFGLMTVPGIDNARLAFAADGTFAGSTGCRGFTGRWSQEGDSTMTSGAVFAEGACAGPLADVDRIVVEVFEAGFAAVVDGDHLAARPRDNLGLDYFAES